MKKRILIALGGTGGHVFPALSCAEELKAFSYIELEFIGGKLDTNSYFDPGKQVYHNIACGKWNLKSFSFFKECSKIVLGCCQSVKVLKKLQPDLVVGFGSYHSFPAILAAKFLRIPFILHESNSIPGRVVKFFSPFAAVTTIYFPEAQSHLRGNVQPVQMPLRKVHKGSLTKAYARKYFKLSHEPFTVLVFGGSQGASSINKIFSASAKIMQHKKRNFQVIHFTGNYSESLELRKEYTKVGIPACVKPFEENMEMAWAAADVVIARAGASSIAEQIEFEVPGILIPYPFAMDNHQEANAAFLSQKQMSLKMLETELSPDRLVRGIDETEKKLEIMKRKIQEYKTVTKAPKLSELILSFL
ncbi:UDP-N-acetylglucosamine--N-acetylmuramyl- (pentapeptide) pyrophosphoryl-undecaprenol N-acetylglucosamine transferase [Chlamydiales bacterium STE3]|nr:UDP-N-acetylglucosamine--N-acetylmuramyl- (pentapeptide) pyrophosphoryl-undecaprenol N-acetylglucosamine transferase [Chlamydiales bacterium STE3]